MFKAEHVLPDRRGRLTKARIALLRRIVLKDILLAPIGTVCLEVEPLLTRLLGELGEQFLCRASLRVQNAVEDGEIRGGEDEVRIRVRIRCTQLKARSQRILDVTDEAHEHRAVARGDRRRRAKGRNDADRRLKARLQAVECVIGRRYERIDNLVVAQESHECAIADGAHIVCILIICCKEVVAFAVLRDGREAQMGMLTISRQSDQRLCLEVHLKPIETEDLADKGTNEELVVRRLYRIVIFPVDLDLLADMGHAAGIVDLRLHAADLFMPHLHVESIFFELDQALLKRRAHGTMRPLPVLLVHHLRRRHLLD